MANDSPIIIALDFANAKLANNFLDQIQGRPCKLKVGLELFIAEGPSFVESLSARGHQVFLDLKLHDIPNTVASACKSAANLGVWLMTLHASGGSAMLEAAHNAMAESSHTTKLVAVTVLTSMDQQQLNGVGVEHSAAQQVENLANVAMQASMDGVVCSVHESQQVRQQWQSAIIVTPGIRMHDSKSDDQSRIATPQQARQAGSNYIVVGRPITQAADPVLALDEYLASWGAS